MHFVAEVLHDIRPSTVITKSKRLQFQQAKLSKLRYLNNKTKAMTPARMPTNVDATTALLSSFAWRTLMEQQSQLPLMHQLSYPFPILSPLHQQVMLFNNITPLVSPDWKPLLSKKRNRFDFEGEKATIEPVSRDMERKKGVVYLVKGERKKWDGKRYARCCMECDKLAQGTTGYCKGHGGGSRCQHEGCVRASRGGSTHCASHGGGKRCESPGCTKAAAGKSLCRKHETILANSE